MKSTGFGMQSFFASLSLSSQIAMKPAAILIGIAFLCICLRAKGQVTMSEWPAAKQLEKFDDIEIKVIDSLEEFTWLSCTGSSFSSVLRAFDYSPVLDKTANLRDFIENHRGCEAYLALMLLLHGGEQVPAPIQAEILCARLGEFDLADEWSWIDLDPEYCTDSYVAKHLVSMGDEALPFLKPLLDRQGRMTYSINYGSEAHSHADGLRLRKCDVASRYVAQILGVPWRLILDLDEREAMLERLRSSIDARLE